VKDDRSEPALNFATSFAAKVLMYSGTFTVASFQAASTSHDSYRVRRRVHLGCTYPFRHHWARAHRATPLWDLRVLFFPHLSGTSSTLSDLLAIVILSYIFGLRHRMLARER
jgi:hypothetical protein